MADHTIIIILLMTIISISQVSAQLSESFYATTCPSVYDTIRAATRSAINRETRVGASLIRLHFHDCFVNGCDGSVLLEDSGTFRGEQNVPGNQGSIKGMNIIDGIKTQVDRACGRSVVSCADILAVAARDSVVELGGSSYTVPVGRRDARTATQDISDIPAPFDDLLTILDKFARKGFSAQEMVALSGTHTVGQARCTSFRDRIYTETNIDPEFATSLRANCPNNPGPSDENLAPLDPQSPNRFGNNYFQALVNRRGLLHSDQVLFNGNSTDSIVRTYANDASAFATDLGNAMAKMSLLSPLTGTQGEIRVSCSRVN